MVAACVTGKATVERFTADDVFEHLDGQFAVTFTPGTSQWTSSVPIDFMMVVEDGTTVRSFTFPVPAMAGTIAVDVVTIVVGGGTIDVPGVVTDAAGNPLGGTTGAGLSAAAVDGITQVTFCAGPTSVGGVRQVAQAPQVLARTGGESTSMALFAIGLVMAGSGLVLLGTDRRRA
jgi:LPXTG-motif cell wall-anchored protein